LEGSNAVPTPSFRRISRAISSIARQVTLITSTPASAKKRCDLLTSSRIARMSQ